MLGSEIVMIAKKIRVELTKEEWVEVCKSIGQVRNDINTFPTEGKRLYSIQENIKQQAYDQKKVRA